MWDETKEERDANRRAAVAYLQTAINSAEGPLRNALRRRAAELILPRGTIFYTTRRRPISSPF